MKNSYIALIVIGALVAGYFVVYKNAPIVAEPTTGEIGVGETREINGLSITLSRITEDSRCPIDVVCIQAGRLVADLALKSGSTQGSVNISSMGEPVVFGEFRVSIIEALPAPVSTDPQGSRDYKITFKVEKST